MLRLLELAAAASLAYRLWTGRWPWAAIRRMIGQAMGMPRHHQVPGQDPARARVLLGVRDDASREAIIEAHKRLIMAVHPDQGGNKDLAQEANAARDVLLAEIFKQEQA